VRPDAVAAASVPGALAEAARSGDVAQLMRLIASGADANSVTAGGDSALHAACSQGDAGCVAVQALLLNGADMTAVDEWGLTPIEVAKCAGEKASGQLIKLLEHESAKKAGGGSTTVRVGAEQAGMGQEDDEWTEAGSDLEELQCADLDGAKSAAQMPQEGLIWKDFHDAGDDQKRTTADI
ncbi:hypothetical protein CYMTET_51496, partial [Cymbomonas tetramitiformis]